MIEFVFKTRAEVISTYLRDYKLRNPSAAVGPGSEPYLKAVLLADQLMPVHAAATQMGRAIQLEGKSIEELQALAARRGVVLAGETGSTGYVTIRASVGGTTLFSGDVCRDEVTRLRFRCTQTKLYIDEEDVPVEALDTGPSTNLDAGSVLQWSSPRPGCSPTCTVAEQTDGSGLTGGANAEGKEQIIAAIIDAQTNPRKRGNAADYRDIIKKTPGIQVEEAFAYPCIGGPANMYWTFTVAPNKYGSRIPSAAQVSAVRTYLTSVMPATQLHKYVECTEEDVSVAIEVTWADTAEDWENETPYPPYLELSPGSGSGTVMIGTVTSATEFTLVTNNGDYTTCGAPPVGAVLGVWDQASRVFRRKKILTSTGTGPYTITCDTTFGASDTSYEPVSGQRVMPWSDSLSLLVAPVVSYFERVGPGELTHDTLDGRRGVRVPASPADWPSKTTNQLDVAVLAVSAISGGDIVLGSGVQATEHLTSPRLLTLADLAIYAE
jgi:uncharacterized phage protein gp47/JayE